MTDTLDRLAVMREAINGNVLSCMEAAGNQRRLHDRQESARRFHGHYVESLEQLRAFGRDALQATLDETTARLERGWEMEGEAVDELFGRLVAHVEMLSDALAGPEATRAAYRERLARVG